MKSYNTMCKMFLCIICAKVLIILMNHENNPLLLINPITNIHIILITLQLSNCDKSSMISCKHATRPLGSHFCLHTRRVLIVKTIKLTVFCSLHRRQIAWDPEHIFYSPPLRRLVYFILAWRTHELFSFPFLKCTWKKIRKWKENK